MLQMADGLPAAADKQKAARARAKWQKSRHRRGDHDEVREWSRKGHYKGKAQRKPERNPERKSAPLKG
jgi:hypothetical protein